MSERPGPADGLGRSSAGTPAFSAPSPPPPPEPVAGAVPARPAQLVVARPSRWPTVLTALVVALVVAVTAVATLVARYADTHIAAPPARSRPAIPSTSATDPDSIDFTSARGSGRLVVRERRWEPGSPVRLRVSVELTCATGTVDHAPTSFQLFDSDGTLVQPSPLDGGPGGIGFGTLGPGEQLRGDVVFEVTRQVVTLVLNDDEGSVTALRIAD